MSPATGGSRRRPSGDPGEGLAARLRVAPGEGLSRRDPRADLRLSPAQAKALMSADAAIVEELQEALWAQRARSILLVLQGMDTSGKTGVIKRVVRAVHPHGARVTAFSAPTESERAQHFLVRIRERLPQPGQVGVFDRSHYEDLIVPRVRDGMVDEDFDSRVHEIEVFEEGLRDDGMTLIKVVLNISYEEQRQRLLERLRTPAKRWKLGAGDLDDRDRWPAFMAAYDEVLAATSWAQAPWYVVPADDKQIARWCVLRLLRDTLVELDPRAPTPYVDLAAMEARLAAD